MQREKVKKLTVDITRACKILKNALSALDKMDPEYNSVLTSLEEECTKEEIKAWVDEAKEMLQDLSWFVLPEDDKKPLIAVPLTFDDSSEDNSTEDDAADKTNDDPLSEFAF